MNKSSDQLAVRNITPFKAFVSVFLMVLLLMLLGTALITFTLPESFVGVARVRTTTPDQAEVFQSKAVLTKVVEHLDLTQRFAQRYGGSEPLSVDRSLDLLRRELQVRRIRNAEVTEIRAYSRIPKEAAEFANAIAQTGITTAVFASAAVDTGSPRIIELAVPGFKPVRPNKLLNYVLGTLVGSLLGVMAGGVAARLALGYGRESRTVSPGIALLAPEQ